MMNETAAVIDVTNTDDRSFGAASSRGMNSSVQSLSVDSFSTIHDGEMLEVNMDLDSDLCVGVDSPQKQSEALETYILYRIVTKVVRIDYPCNEYIVRRRYNDFVWMRQRLIDTYPTCIVPPLPAKHSLVGQLDRYSKDFIIMRMKMLNFFMGRVAAHPIISHDANLKVFLTAKQSEFIAYRKTKNVFSQMSDTIHNLSSSLVLKYKNVEFEKVKDYANNLHEKLSMIEKISLRVNKERGEYITELNQLHPVIWAWSHSETTFSHILIKMSRAFEQSAKSERVLHDKFTSLLSYPIHEYLTYVDGVKETLARRNQFQLAYESAAEDLNKKRVEKDQLMLANQNPETSSQHSHFSLWSSQTNDQRLEKLGTSIPALIKQTEQLNDRLQCANEALRSDLERWHVEKQSTFKRILVTFANQQVEHYQKCVDAWLMVVNNNDGDKSERISPTAEKSISMVGDVQNNADSNLTISEIVENIPEIVEPSISKSTGAFKIPLVDSD